MYSEKVMDHFNNPRNVGEIENPSGVGTVGNAKCGDIMRMYLDIDDNGIIQDVKFKTFGCGAAVATSSMATELVKGKTVQQALEVTNKAVMEALDGLPPVKVHCSLLAEEAIHAALWDYAEKNHITIEGLEKPVNDISEKEEGEEYMLELQHIHKFFNPGSVNEICLFDDFNLTVKDGEFVSVVGSNGSGKTSMLNIICGSIDIDHGQILIDGKDYAGKKDFVRSRQIGRVFQDPSKGTCPQMTILENMSIAENKGKPFNLTRGVNKAHIDYYREMLAHLNLGLEDKMHTPVGALSGGQRQAVALLMATMTPIDFLILDEHTAALDPKTAEIIMQLTDQVVREKKVTTIMVTHNLRYAVEYGSRLLMMHEGKVILDKTGEEKKNVDTEEIMKIFNQISVECGN